MPYQILVLHHQPEMQRLIADRLEASCGAKTCLPVDGYVALDLAQEHSYDLIVLDDELPLLNGTAFIETMRECEVRTPVILLAPIQSSMASDIPMVSPIRAILPNQVNLDRL